MPADQPSAFNLEYLKKRSKRLLRECRAADAEAIAWVQARLPRLRSLDKPALSTGIRLADVQHAVAVERGFSSWGDLTRYGDPLSRLLTAIRGAHIVTLRRELRSFSGLAGANAFAAAALGDAQALRQHLEHDRSLATTPRDGWTPLDYVCSSPLARLGARYAASLCDCAELLLGAGAEPNTAVLDASLPGTPLPAIVRATLAGNLRLVGILEKGGAQGSAQALQHWMSSNADGDRLRLRELFGTYFQRPDVRERMRNAREAFDAGKHGHIPTLVDVREFQQGQPSGTSDAFSDLWPALLDRGLNPASIGATGRSLLHSLVTHAPVSTVEMLLNRGVDFDVFDADGRSVLATAVRAGNFEVADVLRSRGTVDDATPMDQLIGFCRSQDPDRARDVVTQCPGVLRNVARVDGDEFVRTAVRGSIDEVRLMLTCGFPPDTVGESGATALQEAAWHGQVHVVELLLAHGASPTVRDDVYGETALDWAHHGSTHAHGAEEGCLEAARLIQHALSSC
jgi:ankyrin repeat protein